MDIDSDFGPTRGSEVFEHLNELYGKENCCNIITFSNLQARAIIKDVCRCFEVPISEVNNATKFVPKDVKKFNELLEIKELNDFFNKHKGIYQHCEKLYGSPRHHSQHPAGICVLPFPVTDILPVENATPTVHEFVGNMSQFEKENTELIGGVKLDILKLSNLDTLFAQLDIIENEYNEKIELKDIPFDDEKTWNLICDCDTMGIFQMESEIGKGIIKQIQPRNIEELSAVNAFVRPGTSGLEEYCIAKKDNSKIPKFHPKLDKILAPTYGGIVYQEQIMSLISEMMNISFGKADIYRRALEKPNKKGNVELVEDFIKNGVKKAVENGITKEAAEKIQKLIVDNAGYLFNKSHSITYSVISYWTAYIKANYPLVFYISLLNNEPTSKLQDIIQEAKLHNVKILPPDISKSKFQTIIEDKDNNIIRIGLCTVKGIGEKAVQELEPNQPYYNFNDYFSRSGKGSGKAVVEAGIKIGAFESIPLIVSKDSITDELREKLRIEKYDDDNVSVFMSIGEQLIWYNNYIECKAKKSTPNFAIPIDMIKGKYLVDDGIVIENDNTLIIPETFLENFELKEEDVLEYKTRKKPKGKFKDKKQIALSVEERAFRKSINDLLSYKENKIEQYLSNMEDFELSFIKHPLERASKIIPLLNDVHEDAKLRTAGIIVDIIPKTTKNGKQYYHIMLQTPREKQKLTVWNNIYLKQKDLLVKNRIVKVFGKKSFGGITVEYFEDAKSNY